MNHHLTRIAAGAFLSGSIAIAGLALASATAAQAEPSSAADRAIIAVNPPVQNPAVRVLGQPQPDPPGFQFSPGVRVAFDPQPEPWSGLAR